MIILRVEHSERARDMKSYFTLLISLSINLAVFAQSSYDAFHPMTASGAVSVYIQGHILYWENPDSVFYNEIYFSDDSALVANRAPSALLLSGEPTSTVYDSVQIDTVLPGNTKYYWAVIEWYLLEGKLTHSRLLPIWYFYTVPPIGWAEYNFDSDLEGWAAAGPQGTNNWYWSNSSHTPNPPGEMVFAGSPSFTGTSFIMSPVLTEPAGFELGLDFSYYLDVNSDTASVGFGITTDNGNTWDTLWST